MDRPDQTTPSPAPASGALGPKFSPRTRLLEVGGATLLVDPGSGNWLRLSSRGARAVRRLAEPAETAGPGTTGGRRDADAEQLLPTLVQGGFLAAPRSAASAGAGPSEAGRRELKNVLLNLTYRCNLRCSHCAVYAAGPPDRPAVHLAMAARSRQGNGTLETRRPGEASTGELLSLIDRLAERGVRRLVFFGGEPLVRRDFPEILARAAKRIPSLGLTTNGILLSPEICHLIHRHGVEVQVSLDGSCAEVNDRIRGPGSFARTMSGLANLKASGHERVGLKAVFTRWNLDDIPRLVKLGRRLGTALELSPFVALGRGASDRHDLLPRPRELLRAYQRVWLLAEYFEVPSVSFNAFCNRFMARAGEGCGAGCDYVLADWTGDLFPCEGLQQRSAHMGNVRESEVVRSPPAELFSVEELPRCRSCPVRYFCRGGCAAERLVPGGLRAPSMCGFYRLVLPRIAGALEPRASSWHNLRAVFPSGLGPELLRPYLKGGVT